MKRLLATTCLVALCALPLLASAQTSVPGTRPSASASPNQTTLGPGSPLAPVYSATGLVSLSVDALGILGPSGLIQVDKPAGATVRAAYLMAASTGFCSCAIPNGTVFLNGNPIAWDQTVPNAISSNNYLADVTSIVAPIVDGSLPGIVNLTIDETNSSQVDGTILAVVFDNPALTQNFTAVIFFGAQNIAGDDFAISLADGAQPTDPDYKLDLSLGISFGFQGDFGSPQVSLIDVNGNRMTSSAGGEDDGEQGNGALVTAGGIGDVNTNPADPNAGPNNTRYDDELYDLKPFVSTGATLINVHTINPSNDDNILFGGLLVSGAAVVGEGAILTPVSATNPVGTNHTVTATLRTRLGDPIVGKTVHFVVLTGPHAGTSGDAVTDVNGEATFTYLGVTQGVDQIQASFVNSAGETVTSNIVTKEWTRRLNDPPNCQGAFASEATLWPPNHKYHAITVEGVTDPDGDPVTITVTSVTQDEPVNGRGDGNTCPDAQIVGGQASVRAERTGTPGVPGNGRVYTINFTADDGQGNTCTGSVNVCVPHDQGAHSTCLDDGQRYNSLGPCKSGDSGAPEAVSLSIGTVSSTEAQVSFSLPADGVVDIAVFDVTGRRLATVENGQLSSGTYSRVWNTRGVANGLYFVRMRAGEETLTKTVIKVR